MQKSQSAERPVDGEALLVTGRVRAAEPLLTAPLSGTRCVAYFYRMYRLGMAGPERDSRSPREELPVYWGYASRPLIVDTRFRAFAVAAPQLSGEGAGDVPPTVAIGPATALGVTAGVPPSLVGSWIGTLITIALGVGLIWFATNVWPQLK
jgi:hypothetical protein